MIMVQELIEDEENELENLQGSDEFADSFPRISLHAMGGLYVESYQTMRVEGTYKK